MCTGVVSEWSDMCTGVVSQWSDICVLVYMLCTGLVNSGFESRSGQVM